MSSLIKYFSLLLLITSCVQEERVATYDFKDSILVILDNHTEFETNVQSFIEAKDFLKNDTLNSDSIYFKLIKIQHEINTLHPHFSITPVLYGSIPLDEKLYAFHASPGDRLVNDAAYEVLKYLLSKNRIKESTAIDSWKITRFEHAGLNMLNYLDLENANNVTLIEEEIINIDLATDVLKFTAAKLILDKQSNIDYDRYAEIISGIENYVLNDFILLFNTSKHRHIILEKFSQEERMKILEKLNFKKKNTSNNSTVSRLNKAIKFLHEE